MKIYVITTDDNYALAKSLLRNIDNVNYTRDFGSKAANAHFGDDEMVLAMIDPDLLDNSDLSDIIGQMAGQQPDKLIPVIFDSIERPDFLSSAILYDVKSPKSLDKVRRAVENRILGARPDVTSHQHQRIHMCMTGAAILGIVITIMAIITIIIGGTSIVTQILVTITSLLALLAIILSVVHYKMIRTAKQTRHRNIHQKSYMERLEDATLFDHANTGARDELRSIMGLGYFASENATTIKGYYERVRRMAQVAFVFAGLMCIVGFGVAVGSVFLVIFNFSDNIIIIAVVAIMALAMAMMVQVALKFYKYTVDQVKFYYRAQHENERLIVSVSLAERLNNEKSRDALITKIVKGELDLNAAEMEEDHPHA